MNVFELISQLEDFDSDTPVYIRSNEGQNDEKTAILCETFYASAIEDDEGDMMPGILLKGWV